ncbi:aminotransferase class V-fold PLP-dependent enzyme [Lederbergia sp. NSJ-179]|uniref:aminotransferase class V-fold PLP-dependent enzyme n=1 Tax=Lederbergia sp. NSJ-179 TaxID=2931402 RepID=UPI001FD384C0|nr:aminotransferase class V-fold PLP-dependent enzyme [Lederbergia sp. NSJ-179]MCJ7840827.1 aminotransferase class V-fold PLP-dependent enzyme [Lederbergia sp. NSJ-179]
MSLLFKIASHPSEFEQIEKLNYQTFVEEIPQHGANPAHMLRDRFHDENTYIIGLKKDQVIGMICVRNKRPFSLDQKIGEVEQHLPVQVQSLCEIRLLAVDKAHRNGRVFVGLAQALIRFCLKMGYDAAIISGTTRQQKLYQHLGFQPFAYLTGDEKAAFQPMYLTKAIFEQSASGKLLKEPMNFIPGPATITDEVRLAFSKSPYSHRAKEFDHLLAHVQNQLKSLTNAHYVQILHGTGTLANDVIAAQLSLLPGEGLILVNGEFGGRLINHAKRWGLSFDQHETGWGKPFELEEISQLVQKKRYEWMWAVHCETSTGVLNNIDHLKEICRMNGVKLCLDCVSSLGAVPLDLEEVAFASSVSGKTIGSYTGLSFVFHQEKVQPSQSIPRYIDLGSYVAANGVPYSQSSNLVEALAQALKKYERPDKVYDQMKQRYELIRTGIEVAGGRVLSPLEHSAPLILTIELPEGMNATAIGDNLFLNGYLLHYESSYLRERNWLQISCMNDIGERDIQNMLDVFKKLCMEKVSSL